MKNIAHIAITKCKRQQTAKGLKILFCLKDRLISLQSLREKNYLLEFFGDWLIATMVFFLEKGKTFMFRHCLISTSDHLMPPNHTLPEEKIGTVDEQTSLKRNVGAWVIFANSAASGNYKLGHNVIKSLSLRKKKFGFSL